MIRIKNQTILLNAFLGIMANIRTVSTVKTVIECPDGKLLCPDNVFPMIVKVVLSNDAAGLGTANIFFSTLENNAETSEAESNASQILGTYKIKILNNDKKISASPSWVRLYIVFGNCDNFELIKKKQFL